MSDSKGDARTVFIPRKKARDDVPTKLMRDLSQAESIATNTTEAFNTIESGSAMGGGNGLSANSASHTPKSSGTVFFRPRESETQSSTPEISNKPVTGWLVIVKGAGQGQAFAISYGQQKIGRNNDQDIILNFGDLEISGNDHAIIEYDKGNKHFYIIKGKNLVYLNNERVGAGSEKELATGDEIKVGETILRFVAFCGVDFDWNDK